MPRTIDHDDATHGATLMAAIGGALAGVAIGLILAHRFGGVEGIRRRVRAAMRGGDHLEAQRESEGEAFADEPLDEGYDDEIDEALEEEIDEEAHALEARVLAAFLADPVLRDRPVDISVVDGSVIELSGWVRTRTERQRAAKLAREAAGDGTIANELMIGDPEASAAPPGADR